MTREEAFARCPADSYVEYYGNQWLVIPFARVVQPEFFDCTPGLRLTLGPDARHGGQTAAYGNQSR
jgi:hypothetical protein